MSGFKGDVTFLGFLPRRAGKRREFFARLAAEERVLILYESPQRLAATLAEVAEIMGNRQVLVVRELTTVFEEALAGAGGRSGEDGGGAGDQGGMHSGALPAGKGGRSGVDLAQELLQAARQTGLSGRRLAQEVAARLELPRRRVYQAYLELKARKELP